MRITTFARIEAEFVEREHRAAKCVAATVEARPPGDPPAPPMWERQIVWVTLLRSSTEAPRLGRSTYLSLDYVTGVWPVHAG